VAGRGIETASVFDLFVGEDGNMQRVCSWLDLNKHEVDAAVRYERRLSAA
jgi:hypothetical protein